VAALNQNPPLFTFNQNSTGQDCIKATYRQATFRSPRAGA
jgi:hypothetical protein